MKHLLLGLEFSPKTIECTQEHLNGTIYDLLCAEAREENLDDLLDFVIHLIETRVLDRTDKWVEAIKLGAKIIKKTKQYIFQYIVDAIGCPNVRPGRPLLHPMKTRRQFGVKDMLHTLRNVYCDPLVVKGIGMYFEMKFNNTYSTWLLGTSAEYWCCLVNGEWDRIVPS